MALSSFFLVLLFLFPTYNALSSLPQEKEDVAFQVSLIEEACTATADRYACAAFLYSEYQRSGRRGHFPLLHAAVRGTINSAIHAVENVSGYAVLTGDLREQMALDDCVELLHYTVHHLGRSLSEIGRMESGDSNTHLDGNLRTWLSAALSNQDTCLEGFDGTDGRLRRHLEWVLNEVAQLVRNVLAMYKRVRSIIPHTLHNNNNNNNNTSDYGDVRSPPWISAGDEELMKGDPKAMHVDAVVAADGSGRFRSVNEAVDRAPDHSEKRYVIYVKKGVYRENVEMKKTNIVLIGDGIGVTVITGSRSFMQGCTTFRSATFAVSGQGFIARDITFRNTAGPQNFQAVALRVTSDRSAFFRCSMEGYQDTLYAHSLRQFYRDCHISGTVDFIFGNGQAVFQGCKIFTRRPLPLQQVVITAQGRDDRNQNTGFSFHACYVFATLPTYLGRPWKAYSRTVFMQSYLSVQVQPAGWLEWMGNFALDTLFYGEYMNYGPGSVLNGRVRWPGYHVLRNAAVARFFTVRRFIDGSSWLPGTGVQFSADLLK